jgi:ABC-type multidrug transport system ATPase subunit
MDSLGFPDDWVWRPVLALTGYVFAFYAGAAVLLKYWNAEIAMARARPSNMDASAGKEKMSEHTPDEVRTINIRLDGFGLDIEKRTLRSQATKTILNPLTAEFQPGSLNVIMGPSGSGKTSLLNSMAGRLKDDFSTRYKTSGTMTFNGLAPSEDVIHSICSFVTQDDDALLASLTVRETLRYAAGLRLPKWMSKQQKVQKAEEILLKMGLKDCADNLIGNDLIKGISGGEKRRVTIAVQILTEPRVLLLDEPLSGLDAFTALSIMDVLSGLAHEGRTLIVTIHQPRSDLFDHFGSILLLARGGHPVFAGPATHMLPHFAAQGYACPRHVNPADFALDLITVDLQHAAREEASREKVRKLVEAWHPDLIPVTRTGSLATPAELGSLAREPASFVAAYSILIRRATKNFFRTPDLIIARIMQVVGLGIVLALFFAPLKNDYFSIQNRMGFLVEIAPLYFVGMLNNIATYPVERDVFYRDYDDRIYGVEAFFLTYISITTPFEIISCFIFAILAVLAVGLKRDAATYFIITFNAFCITSCGESLGIAFNTLFSHTGFSVNIMSVFLSVAQVMGKLRLVNFHETRSNPNEDDRWRSIPQYPLLPASVQSPVSRQMGRRQYGALHTPRPAVHLRSLAEDQRTVSHYHRAAGSGAVQARQRSRDVHHGAGYMRDSVPVLGLCRAEVCQGEVGGKIVEEGRRREEERACQNSCTELRCAYRRFKRGQRYPMD